jgi:hypothetical protein
MGKGRTAIKGRPLRDIRERLMPNSLAGGPIRQRAKNLYGRWWRPERPKKRYVYELVDVFLEANPHVQFSALIDFAMITLFSLNDPRAKEMFEAEASKLNITFPWSDQ